MRRRVREEDEIGELNIVPYLDIVTNLLMFLLVSIAGLIHFGILDVDTPKTGEPASAQAAPPDKTKELMLTVGISDQGFYVAGAGGVLPGDASKKGGGVDTTKPPTVPKKGGDYDYDGLTNMLADIKKMFPKESRVILVAEMTIPYEIIIHTMDACREKLVPVAGAESQHAELFPQVWLSMMQ